METQESDFGIALWATDVFATAAFLERVAGLSVEERHPGYARLRAGEAVIAVHDDESYRGHPWFDALRREGAARGIGAELRFRVDSVPQAFEEAMKLGGQSIAPPYEFEGTLECQVMAPDGYLCSLWQVWNSPTST